jgi:ABC-type nitrate/sulfonate/bicarbonate transport system permease component
VDAGLTSPAPVAAIERATLRWSRGGLMEAVRATARTARRMDLLALAGIALLLGVWWLIAAIDGDPHRFPTPWATIGRMIDSFGSDRELRSYRLPSDGLGGNALFSTVNVLIGASCGCVLGMVIGLVSARSWLVRAALNPVLTAIGVVPVIIAMPFFFVWFGTGRIVAWLFVMIYSLLIVALYSQRAVENLDPVYERSARVSGASRSSLIRHVLLPGTLPEVLAGIRIALAGAWGFEALAELIAVPQGLGQTIEAYNSFADVQGMLAAVLLLCLIAVGVDALAVAGIRLATNWRER